MWRFNFLLLLLLLVAPQQLHSRGRMHGRGGQSFWTHCERIINIVSSRHTSSTAGRQSLFAAALYIFITTQCDALCGTCQLPMLLCCEIRSCIW